MAEPSPRRVAVSMSVGWLIVLLIGLGATDASAIPAFARKYQTSCQTCHVVFPKLNAFGEAFRLAGYRMPKETEEMIKEKPVSLGSPAYKRLWPKAVWPGEISSAVPLAVNFKFADVNTSTLNADGTVTKVWNDFQFPQEANIFAAGTLGEHVSYLGELSFSQNPDDSVSVSIEHANIAFDSPFGPENMFHFKVGKFTPNLVDGFQEMWISTDAGIDTAFAYNPIGLHGGTGLVEGISPEPIGLPKLIRGIEGYGIVNHRILYVAGIANGISPGPNGRFDGNNAKDYYARVDYKFGGMGLDGDMGGREAPAENWRDDSLRVGAFVYRGDGSDINYSLTTDAQTPVNMQDVNFLRTGLYASVYWRDLNVYTAYVHGTDTLRTFDPANRAQLDEISPSYHSWFAQADYVFYPWLHGAFRYELLRPGDPDAPSVRLVVANASALIRANVKAIVEYQRDLETGENHSFNIVVRFAF
ncbi:MAG TPA: hypothetical protein VGK32_04590 [Vicinamibacterales bacterium]